MKDIPPNRPSLFGQPLFVWPVLIWIIALEIIGAGIGLMTSQNIDSWYAGLARAPLNPPDWAFGVVWPILYAMIAIAGWRLWQRRYDPGMGSLVLLYMVQLIMNWGWSFVFFGAHLLWLSFIWIFVLAGLVAVLIILAYKKERVTAYLLLPYLLWISFASYLCGYIALFNT